MKSFILLVIVAGFSNCDMSSDLQKSFTDNEVIPDVLKTAPAKILDVSYPDGVVVNLGNELRPTQTKFKPTVKWPAEQGAFYTLIKTDPDAPSRTNPSYREIRHWLVMNIPGADVEKGDEVVEYIGAGPPTGTGLHRYIFLVFKQPNGKIEHDEPRATNTVISTRMQTSTMDLAKKYNFGDPEYGNLYQAQYDEYSDILGAQFKG